MRYGTKGEGLKEKGLRRKDGEKGRNKLYVELRERERERERERNNGCFLRAS